MRLEDMAVPTFARHETFHPRYGWFRKAYATTATDPQAFGRDSAPVDIGVGKNMVRAIQFWGLAAKLICEDSHSPNRRLSDMLPTRFGQALFGRSGWDPYMEDPGTSWLLHWMLLAPPSRLPVWWYAFNEFHPLEFDKDGLEMAFISRIETTTSWNLPSQSSVSKDVSALIRTYSRIEDKRNFSNNDLLDCPLRELHLIDKSIATQRYRFKTGIKATLPPEVALFAVLDFLDRIGTSADTAMFSRLATESGSPAKAFRLSEQDLVSMVTPALDAHTGLDIITPNGAPQLVWDGELATHAVAVLNAYYDNDVAPDCAGLIGSLAITDSTAASIGLSRDDSGTMQPLADNTPLSRMVSA